MGKEHHEKDRIAMSPQQRRFSASNRGALETYRDLVVGNESWLHLLGYEFYNLFLNWLPGLPGYGLRRCALPHLLSEGGKAISVGQGVSLRQPKKMHLGKGVLLDDYCALDVRTTEDAPSDAGIYLGDHVLVGRYSVVISKNAVVKLGDACNISSHCRIGSQKRLEIGKSVLIAAYTYIGAGNHRMDDPNVPIIEQGEPEQKGVFIGDNVWIGASATILDGVKIGKDAVIGAHSLVLDDVPERAIAVGSPAKVIRYR